MREELRRNIADLKVDKLQKPYFIEYTLTLHRSYSVKATLGSLTESDSSYSAKITVSIRVGDYKFDNSNFFDFGMSFFGSGDDEELFKNRAVPYELDYKTLRRELWLATDAAYKQVAESFSKKESALKNRIVRDTTQDFMKINSDKSTDTYALAPFACSQVEPIIKKISAVFADYPEVNVSSCGFEYIPQKIYYVNSEGAEYIKNDVFTGIEYVASTQSSDGLPVSDFYTFYSKLTNQLPSQDSLVQAAKNLAENIKLMKNASRLDESYSGPVIFEGQAAAESFAQLFAPNLITQRQQMTENGMSETERNMAFQSKIGGRVLPEFLSVSDKPSLENYNRTILIGNYFIDDDGLKPSDVTLVENGFLKSLLSERIPTKRVHYDNGHKRGGAAMFSNILLNSDETHKLSAKDIREKMMKLCKDRELPYGIVVKRVINQNVLFTSLLKILANNFSFFNMENKLLLTQAFKVFPDGHEEPIVGLIANGMNAQSFKDILFVSNSNYALNLLASSVISPYITGGLHYIASSVICPDILFEDLEIKSIEDNFPKPPILARP